MTSMLFYGKNSSRNMPYCSFLDVIKWCKQCGHQRYKCKSRGSRFTFRRKNIRYGLFFYYNDLKRVGVKVEVTPVDCAVYPESG